MEQFYVGDEVIISVSKRNEKIKKRFWVVGSIAQTNRQPTTQNRKPRTNNTKPTTTNRQPTTRFRTDSRWRS